MLVRILSKKSYLDKSYIYIIHFWKYLKYVITKRAKIILYLLREEYGRVGYQ